MQDVDTDFDFSDVSVDGVREILDVAVDVLRDYGNIPGNTRIERLARFCLLSLKADVITEDNLCIVRNTTADDCREIATYWLLLADSKEH